MFVYFFFDFIALHIRKEKSLKNKTNFSGFHRLPSGQTEFTSHPISF